MNEVTTTVIQKKLNLSAVVISFVLFCSLLYLPLFQNQQAQHAFALLVLVAVLWISEAIPLALTALLIPVIAALMQLVSPKEAFKEFGNPIIFLFMGGFALAGALSRYSLDKRLAQKLIGLARGNFYWSSILLMLATSFLACWVSNTSSAAMMIPLGVGMLVLANKNIVSPESKFLMLGIAYAANIGGIITMIATPPNAIGAAILGLSFSEWMMYGLPVFVITFPLMVIVLTLYFKPDKKLKISALVVQYEIDAPNKTLAAIFLFTVFLWVMDGVLAPLLNITDGFNSLVAVIAIFLLFITRVLNWDEIIKSIQWKVLLLFGGGLTLGMLIDQSGLGMILVSKVSQLITVIPLFFFLWIIVLFSIILTEFMSNTASAALILPLLFTMSNQLHINPMILVFPATIAASYGFMMPVGTPPNAMVFATGLVPQNNMIKAGFVLNLLFSIILTLFFYLIFS
jgi:sodium-dependent dicarboxylate transporter 2/3/5